MFLAKGSNVSFLVKTLEEDGDEEEIVLPITHILVHDPLGEIIRSCDIYVVRWRNWSDGISDSDQEMRNLAQKYYGSHDRLGEVDLEIPTSGWKYLSHVKKIRYWRQGHLANKYQHKYAEPQPLFFCKKSQAWRIVHPDECVVNHRGFVHP